ncbi:hypothetical protein [Pseudonocardia asaccharolytica]|uniref:Uncharacterized protein n=1 Tax=Pseudonocardia asaccharolytica DSM 44247 = NBRC 16224 TaxID=1123024 RepID=A0A511DA76_9PSEU|nr:hypothetical protein [Pseudonocardia asaccharolytica]GEL20554.1 hypothetical protein PA7_43910 [Pseudonocardia asaccharolytica DSM 44247 = NBRC 16224]
MAGPNRPARLNRALLILFGLLFFAAGVFVLTTGLAVLPAMRPDDPGIPTQLALPGWASWAAVVADTAAPLAAEIETYPRGAQGNRPALRQPHPAGAASRGRHPGPGRHQRITRPHRDPGTTRLRHALDIDALPADLLLHLDEARRRRV